MTSWRFPALFFLLLTLLTAAYYGLSAQLVEDVIVRYFTVIPGSRVLDALTPDIHVSSEGTRIVSSLARLNVLKGCEGTEALLMLYAAMMAVPRPVKYTLIGLISGTVLVFLVNQVRIISLFFIAAYHKNWFELVHGFLAPIIIVLLTAVFFFRWLKWSQPTRERAS